MSKHIGFTGTRQGMPAAQRQSLAKAMSEYTKLDYVVFHHGDCLGADAEAHEIASNVLLYEIVIHPPQDDKYRAFCKTDLIHTPKPYLQRNRDIVDATEILFACPKGKLPERRSGTWSTIRYAVSKNKPVIVIFPDGVITTGKESLE